MVTHILLNFKNHEPTLWVMNFTLRTTSQHVYDDDS